MRYDADVAPEPSAWLALDPSERLALIQRHHRGRVERTLHQEGYNRQIHGGMHLVIEDQIARGEPAITGATVERLVAEGVRRHVAVHMVAGVLLEMLGQQQAFDADHWQQALQKLDAATWLAAQMKREIGSLS
jgi:hypothetical protein